VSVEQFSNLVVGALAAPVFAASPGDAGSITVVTTSGWPTVAQYRLVVGAGSSREILLVTGPPVAGVVPVLRGQEGTPAGAHPTGTPVANVLTAGALTWLRDGLVGGHAGVPCSVSFRFRGTLSAGMKEHTELPFDCHVEHVTVLAEPSGNAVVDVGSQTYGAFSPTSIGTSICAAAKPTLASATKYQDSTLTGWTRDLLQGRVLGVNIDSVGAITRLVVELQLTRVIN
jgi:hypothetical protein